VTTNADNLHFGLPLTPADIAPPITFRCRHCGTERLWAEQECSGGRLETTKQERGRGNGT
jgi:hypothetical protein